MNWGFSHPMFNSDIYWLKFSQIDVQCWERCAHSLWILFFYQLLWPWVANFPKSYLIHFNTVILGWHIVVWSLIIVRTSWSIQHWKELVSGIQRTTIWLVVWNMFFMTFHSVGNVIHILGIIIIPTDEVICLKGVGQPPTRKCVNMCSVTYLANKHLCSSHLVGGLEYVLFFHNILGIIIPTDQYFSRWLKPPTIQDGAASYKLVYKPH